MLVYELKITDLVKYFSVMLLGCLDVFVNILFLYTVIFTLFLFLNLTDFFFLNLRFHVHSNPDFYVHISFERRRITVIFLYGLTRPVCNFIRNCNWLQYLNLPVHKYLRLLHAKLKHLHSFKCYVLTLA